MPNSSHAFPEDLWESGSREDWSRALGDYVSVVQRQGVDRLPELDRWVREDLPRAISARAEPHVTLEELVEVTRWKMSRGVWRARNLALVQSNAPDAVIDVSRKALSEIPDPRAPITILAWLDGVGPATASAVAAAAAPHLYPFFDEVAAAQVPHLGRVAFSGAYYQRYADALRERARSLGDGWTPVMVERALWAHAGGKAGRVRV